MSGIPPIDHSSPAAQGAKREIIELIKMVALFLVLFMLLKTFVVEGYEVSGPSMYPTLEDSDRILVLKLPLKLSHLPLLGGLEPVGTGDIVVFESRDGSQKRYIKRVVARGPSYPRRLVSATADNAEPGVRVQFLEGALYVDQRRIEEHYLIAEEQRSPDIDDAMLGIGEYYVLGDHRSLSKDSRNFGPIHEEQIIGRAVFRFWPLTRIGLLRTVPAS